MSIGTQRARLYVAAVTAFVGGLIVASGMNWTKLGFAQSRPSAAQVQPIAEASNAFVAIANNVTPAVVSIEVFSAARSTPSSQRGRTATPQNVPPGMEDFFRQFDIPQQSRPTRGQGSGFIVTSNGYILTNNHVVTNSDRETIADKVTVRMMDHRVFTAKVVGHDRTTDVAVIKIDGSNLPTVSLGNDVASRIGEWVLAIGNPLGLENTVTAGIISAKGRSLGDLMNPDNSNRYAISDLIQTDAAINPGNSGGALVDGEGRLVGVNTAILSRTGGFQGIGFAIPANLARNVMEQLVANGKVVRGYLGVTMQDINTELADQFKLSTRSGALVADVVPESPADKAGLKGGDVITQFEGKPVLDSRHLKLAVANFTPGQKVSAQVLRENKKIDVQFTVAARPSDRALARADGRGGNLQPDENDDAGTLNGVGVGELDPQTRQEFDVPSKVKGALVTSVDPDSPAAAAGLQPGDVIQEINRQPVKTADEAVKLTEKSGETKKTLLRVWSQRGSRFVVVDETEAKPNS
jgi:serine protease Do